MSLFTEIVDSFSGNKRAVAQAIVNVARELQSLEEWLNEAEIDEDNVHLAVGQEVIAQDVHALEKGYKITIRLDKSLTTKWDNELAADWRRVVLDLLVIKYDIALGEGFEFNEENASSFPETAKLDAMDDHSLLMHFQESFDSIQELYAKYFPRG